MKYDPHTLCDRPLRYLIQEGFIILKMIPISEGRANLVLDMRQVPNLPVNKQELDVIAKDADFLQKYSGNISNSGNGDSSSEPA